MTSLVELDQVTKVYVRGHDGVYAVQHVDLEVERGSFVSIVGPSGCGKSTLLQMVAGLVKSTTGSVRYSGAEVTEVNTAVGYVTQHDNLLPWRNVYGNIALGLEMRGVNRSAISQRVGELVTLVGLEGFERSYPRELSGGMRKRTGLARSMAYNPECLLMDEPFAALDALLRQALQAELIRIFSATSLTVVFVTHDLEEALLLSDRVVVMSRRPSVIKAVRDVDLPRPRDLQRDRFRPAFRDLYMDLWHNLHETDPPSDGVARVAGGDPSDPATRGSAT